MYKKKTHKITLYKHINALISKLYSNNLNNTIRVLSGRTETVELLYKIIAKIGDDPNKWLPVFIQRSKDV